MKPSCSPPTNKNGAPSLDSLLRRGDIWRGHSQAFITNAAISTGYEALDAQLLHKGWPEACLIELAQPKVAASWLLFSEAAKHISCEGQRDTRGMVILLNPPYIPYAVALLQMGIPLDRLLVVQIETKADFVRCFVDLCQSKACSMLLSWQPKTALSYSELRKCQLATHEQAGLYVLFRHSSVLKQSSPAALRVELKTRINAFDLFLVKQKGKLHNAKISLPLPESWFSQAPYSDLDHHGAIPDQLILGRVMSIPASIQISIPASTHSPTLNGSLTGRLR
jgi:protein ImuA